MKILLITLIAFLGCGEFKGERGKRGVKGDTGATGQIGPQGPTGPAGDDGQLGGIGERGPRGDQGIPGNIDNIVDGGWHCRGRTSFSYGWYELNIWVYNLSTGERYMHGRSDLHRENSFSFPDSASFFGDFVETASFRFDVLGDRHVNWEYKRNGRTGRFDCGKAN